MSGSIGGAIVVAVSVCIGVVSAGAVAVEHAVKDNAVARMFAVNIVLFIECFPWIVDFFIISDCYFLAHKKDPHCGGSFKGLC